jgi:hypothetical protein
MVSRLELRRESVNQRQARVIELVSKGKSLSEIAKLLQVDVSTISRDYQFVKDNAAKIIDEYVNEVFPLEIVKCIARLNAVSDEAWAMSERAQDYKEKTAALALAMRAAVQIVSVIANHGGKRLDALDPDKAEEREEKPDGKKSREPDPAETAF